MTTETEQLLARLSEIEKAAKKWHCADLEDKFDLAYDIVLDIPALCAAVREMAAENERLRMDGVLLGMEIKTLEGAIDLQGRNWKELEAECGALYGERGRLQEENKQLREENERLRKDRDFSDYIDVELPEDAE